MRSMGLQAKNPILALSYLIRSGLAERPAPHAYLQHPQWKKIWMHSLDNAGIHPGDDFAALAAIRELEQRMISASDAPQYHQLGAAEGVTSGDEGQFHSDAGHLFNFARAAALGRDDSLLAGLGEHNFPNRIRKFRYMVDLLVFVMLPVDMVVAKKYGARADEVRGALYKLYEEHVSDFANSVGLAPELGHQIAVALLTERFDTYTTALKSRDNDHDRGLALGVAAYRVIFGGIEAGPEAAVILGLAFFCLLQEANAEFDRLRS